MVVVHSMGSDIITANLNVYPSFIPQTVEIDEVEEYVL